MAAIPDDTSADPAVVDVNVTQPWLSTKATRRRRFCHRSDDVRNAESAASFALHDKRRHYIKKERQHLCATHDPHISRRPSQFCRKNGFDRPLNALQILSWFFFAFIVVVGCILIIPALSIPLGATFGVLFILSAVGVAGVALAVTHSDPADPLIFESCEIKRQLQAKEDLAVCDLCGPTHLKSKHCRACNKCVGNFDHHCKWLNNCIGESNYKLFLILIILVGILATLALAFGVVVIIEEAVYHRVAFRFAMNMGSWNVIAYFIALGVFMTLNLALLGLDLQLVALHVYLVREGITTFEYITQRVQPLKQAEAADAPEQPHKACCAEWIVIDKRRLKRARDRLSNKTEDAAVATDGVDSSPDTRINVDPDGLPRLPPPPPDPDVAPPPHSTLETAKAIGDPRRDSSFSSSNIARPGAPTPRSGSDTIMTLSAREPKVAPPSPASPVDYSRERMFEHRSEAINQLLAEKLKPPDFSVPPVDATQRPLSHKEATLDRYKKMASYIKEGKELVERPGPNDMYPPIPGSPEMSPPKSTTDRMLDDDNSSSSSSAPGIDFEDDVEEDPPVPLVEPTLRNISSDDTTTGPSQASADQALKAHRLPAPPIAAAQFDCKIRYLDLHRAVTQQPVVAVRPDSVRRWARLLTTPSDGPPKLPEKSTTSLKMPWRDERDAYSTRTVVLPRRPHSTRGRPQSPDPFQIGSPVVPDPGMCMVTSSPPSGEFTLTDCFTGEVNCRDILNASTLTTHYTKSSASPIVKVFPSAVQHHI